MRIIGNGTCEWFIMKGNDVREGCIMYLQVNDINLYYERSGEGRPIILLHGNGESSHIFDVLIGQLKSHFTVYAIDSRGHGKSEPIRDINYTLMMEDAAALINELGLDKPVLYGFSDGGIIGLMLVMKYPEMLSRLVISGANLNPKGVKWGWLFLFRMIYLFTRSPLIKMMLTQPDIKPESLASITIPVLVLAGSKDMIRTAHTHEIAANIPNSQLIILENENHESYVKHSHKLYPVIRPFVML